MAKNSLRNLIIIVVLFAVFICGYSWVTSNKSMTESVQNSGEYNMDEQADSSSESVIDNSGPLEMHSNSFADATSGNGEINALSEHEGMVGENNMASKSTDPSISGLRSASCFPKDQLTATELLPQSQASTWASVNPEGQGTLKNKNFVQAGHHVGVNTVGQTLRNANLQLRSEPPNPQIQVSPWQQSTMNPDTNRKPLEIGGCA